MDRKSFIILAVCGALFALWIYFTPKLYPPVPPGATNSQATALGTNAIASPGAAFNPAPAVGAVTNPPAATGTVLPPPNFVQPAATAPEQTLLLSNRLVRLTFTSRGGGLKLVELLQHRESVACGARKKADGDRLVALNGPAALPVLALANEDLDGDGVYRLTSYTPAFSAPSVGTNGTDAASARMLQGVRAEKLLSNGVFIVKEFEVGADYLLEARVRFENRGLSLIA